MNFEQGLIDLGIPIETTKQIISHFAGEMIYIPKKIKSKIERDAEIVKRFTGNNHRELAKEFDLTVRHIQKITNKN